MVLDGFITWFSVPFWLLYACFCKFVAYSPCAYITLKLQFMRLVLLLLSFVLAFGSLQAQKKSKLLDAQNSYDEAVGQKDTAAASLYLKQWEQQAMAFINTKPYNKDYAISLSIGQYYMAMNDRDSIAILPHLHKALTLVESGKDYKSKVKVYEAFQYYYWYKNTEVALKYTNLLINELKKDPTESIFVIYMDKWKLGQNTGNYALSEEALKELYDEAKLRNNLYWEIEAFFRLEGRQFPENLLYSFKERISTEMNSRKKKSNLTRFQEIYGRILLTEYGYSLDSCERLEFLKSAIPYFVESNNYYWLAKTYRLMSEEYFSLDIDSSLFYARKSLGIFFKNVSLQYSNPMDYGQTIDRYLNSFYSKFYKQYRELYDNPEGFRHSYGCDNNFAGTTSMSLDSFMNGFSINDKYPLSEYRLVKELVNQSSNYKLNKSYIEYYLDFVDEICSKLIDSNDYTYLLSSRFQDAKSSGNLDNFSGLIAENFIWPHTNPDSLFQWADDVAKDNSYFMNNHFYFHLINMYAFIEGSAPESFYTKRVQFESLIDEALDVIERDTIYNISRLSWLYFNPLISELYSKYNADCVDYDLKIRNALIDKNWSYIFSRCLQGMDRYKYLNGIDTAKMNDCQKATLSIQKFICYKGVGPLKGESYENIHGLFNDLITYKCTDALIALDYYISGWDDTWFEQINTNDSPESQIENLIGTVIKMDSIGTIFRKKNKDLVRDTMYKSVSDRQVVNQTQHNLDRFDLKIMELLDRIVARQMVLFPNGLGTKWNECNYASLKDIRDRTISRLSISLSSDKKTKIDEVLSIAASIYLSSERNLLRDTISVNNDRKWYSYNLYKKDSLRSPNLYKEWLLDTKIRVNYFRNHSSNLYKPSTNLRDLQIILGLNGQSTLGSKNNNTNVFDYIDSGNYPLNDSVDLAFFKEYFFGFGSGYSPQEDILFLSAVDSFIKSHSLDEVAHVVLHGWRDGHFMNRTLEDDLKIDYNNRSGEARNRSIIYRDILRLFYKDKFMYHLKDFNKLDNSTKSAELYKTVFKYSEFIAKSDFDFFQNTEKNGIELSHLDTFKRLDSWVTMFNLWFNDGRYNTDVEKLREHLKLMPEEGVIGAELYSLLGSKIDMIEDINLQLENKQKENLKAIAERDRAIQERKTEIVEKEKAIIERDSVNREINKLLDAEKKIKAELCLKNKRLEEEKKVSGSKAREARFFAMFMSIFAVLLIALGLRIQKKKKELEAIYKEYRHRVKNNLQEISSIATLLKESEFKSDVGAQAALGYIQGHVHALGNIHKHLQEKQGGVVHLKESLENMVQYMAKNSRIEIEYEVDDFNASQNKASLLGKIINELITNTNKHAYEILDKSKKAELSIKRISQQEMIFTYQDYGKGVLDEDPNMLGKQSSGMYLMLLFVKQLAGKLEPIKGDRGFLFQFTFKI